MKLVDLHCDTAMSMCRNHTLLSENDHNISLNKLDTYENYAQVMAVYIPHSLSDADGYSYFHEAYGYLASQLASNSSRATLLTCGADIRATWEAHRGVMLLSLEDARILQNDITKLNILHQKGVRFIVLMWSGETCIGGSHNTEIGLTEFGRQVVNHCFELGIVPDVSHASAQTTSDILELAEAAGLPAIASHSNSYAVHAHSRNLRDEHFEHICRLGGIVGLSLCPSHLAPQNACVDDILRHAEHYLALGGEDTICLGCDLDGTELPTGFHDVRDLTKISDAMSRIGYSDELIDKIFWKNAKSFIEKHIK